MSALGLRLWSVLYRGSSTHNSAIRAAAYRAAPTTIERLEPRMLLSLTAAQVIYNWKHAHPGFLHDLAVYEYEHPDFAARQNADLRRLGLPAITPIAPTLTASATSSARGTHHPRPHKPHKPGHPKPIHVRPPHHKPRHHVRGNGPMVKDNPSGPTVTNASFTYWTLPETATFTFSEDVSASINGATSKPFTVENMATGVDYTPNATITANSPSQTATISFGGSSLPKGQYVVKLISSQITDSSNAQLVGSDGVSGHNYTFNFFYVQGDFDGNGVVDAADESLLGYHFNQSGTYTQGDANYNGYIDGTDSAIEYGNYGINVALGIPSFVTPSTTVNSALISWSNSDPNAQQYTLTRSLTSTGSNPVTVAGATSSTSIQDAGLTPGQTYYYTVTAIDVNGCNSMPSQTLAVTLPAASSAPAGYTLAPPQPPTALQASPGTGSAQDNTISLSWSASTTPGVNYEIDRSGQAIGGTNSSTRTFTDTGLDANKTYTYSVFAVDAGGNKSAAAVTSAATGADVTPPNPPLDLQVTAATSSTVSLSWVQPSDNLGVNTYNIYRNGTQVVSVVGSSTTYTDRDSSLTAGTSYTYSVGAVDAAGYSSKTTQNPSITVTTPGGSPTSTNSSPNQYIPPEWQNDFYNNMTSVLRQRMAAIIGNPLTPPAARYWYDPTDKLISGTAPASNQTQIKGAEGSYDYEDVGNVGYYETGDPVWLDADGDHIYDGNVNDHDTVIIAPPFGSLAAGTWGKTNGICSALVNGSPVVWADNSTDFSTDFAAFYVGLNKVLPYYEPAATTDLSKQDDIIDVNNPSNDVLSVGSLLASMKGAPLSVIIPNDTISIPSSSTTVSTISDSAGTLTKELVSGDSIQLNGSWYSIKSFTNTQITLATPYIGPAVASSSLMVRNWTLVPSTTDSDTGMTFQYERGLPAAGNLIFKQQFDELHYALGQLNQLAPYYDQTNFGVDRSNHFLTVAGEVLNAYESVFGSSPFAPNMSEDTQLRTQLLNGGGSQGAIEQSYQITELRDLVQALEGAIYERDGSGGFKLDADGNPMTFADDQNWLDTELWYIPNGDNHAITVRVAGSWSNDALGNPLGPGSLIDPEHLAEIERVLQGMTIGPVDPVSKKTTTDQALWISMDSSPELLAKVNASAGKGNEQGDQVTDSMYPNAPTLTKWQPEDPKNIKVGSSAAGSSVTIWVGNLGFARAAINGSTLDGNTASDDYSDGTVTTVLPSSANPNGGVDVTTITLGPSPIPVDTTGWQWGSTATVFAWSQSDVQGMLTGGYGWTPPDPGVPAANALPNRVNIPGPDATTWGTQGAFTWNGYYTVSSDSNGNYSTDTYNKDVDVSIWAPSIFGKVPLGTPFPVPSDTTDGPDGSQGRTYPGGPGWTGSTLIAPEPGTPVSLTSEMDFRNTVPDSNLDGIVQIPVDLQSFGNDTGVMSFLPTNNLPQAYIPVFTNLTGALPINGYLVQGAFGDGTDSISDLLNNSWQADGTKFEDANQDGLPYGYSLNTFIRPNLLINDSTNHIKRMEVIRPGGNVVVFNFQWNSATGDFSTIGTPTGWDQRDDARTYVLRYVPSSAGAVYQLEFASGITQTFDSPDASTHGALTSVSDSTGLTQAIGGSHLNYHSTSHSLTDSSDSTRYTITLKFKTDTQENGFLNEVDYQTIAEGTNPPPAQTITTSIGYTSATDRTINALNKSDGGNIDAFSYTLSGQTITNNGVTLARTQDQSGDAVITKTVPVGQSDQSTASDTYVINSDNLVTKDTYTLTDPNGGPTTTAVTQYQYDTGDRSTISGFAPWGHLLQVIHPDGSWEAFTYDHDTGWMTEDITPFKNSTWDPSSPTESSQVVKYFNYDGIGYFASGDSTTVAFNGQAADPMNLVEQPRVVTTRVLGTITGEVLNKAAPIVDSNGIVTTAQVVSRTIPADTAALWSNGVFQTATQITAYNASTTTGPSGQSTQSVSVDPSTHVVTQTLSQSFGGTTLSSQTIKTNPFNQTINGQNSAVGTPFSSDNSNIQDAFGRSTSDSISGGVSTSASFNNTGNLWFGPQSVTETDGSTTKYTYTPLGQVATKIVYFGTAHAVQYGFTYDAAGNVVSETVAPSPDNTNPVKPPAITNTFQFDAMSRLTKEVDNTTGGDVTANRQTTHNYTSTANGIVEDITYPDGSTEEKITNLDGSPQSDTGNPASPGTAAVTPSTYDEGVVASDTADANGHAESAGSTWTSVTTGGSSNTTTTFTNMLGEAYLTQQSTPSSTSADSSVTQAYADATTQFDGNGRAVETTAADGTQTHVDYDPQTGQAADTWVDMNQNGVYDPGIDRKTIRTLSPATTNGASAFVDTKSLSASGISESKTTTTLSSAGTDVQQLSDGLLTDTLTSPPSGGSIVNLTSNPDGTKLQDVYADGLLTTETSLGTSGLSLWTDSWQYNGLRENTAFTDWTGTTTFGYFSDGTQESQTLPGHSQETVTSVNAGTEDPTAATRSDGTSTSGPENFLGLASSQSGAGVIPANFGYDASGTGQMNSLTTYQNATVTNGVVSGSGAATTSWNVDQSTGELASQTFADGSSDSLKYNSAGQLTSMSTPMGSGSFRYNAAGEQVFNGMLGSQIMAQDEFGRPLIVTDTSNNKAFTEAEGYTNQDQLQSEQFGSAGNASVSHQYYQPGDASAAAEPGSVQSTTLNLPNGQQAQSTTYGYDPSSKRLQTITANGNSFILIYAPNTDWLQSIEIGSLTETFNPKPNSGGLLDSMSVTTPAGNTPTLYSASYTYYPTDQRQTDTVSVANSNSDGTVSMGGGTYTYQYAPSKADALTSVTYAPSAGGSNVSWTYGQDDVGNVTSKNGTASPFGTANSVNEYSSVQYDGGRDLSGDGTNAYTFDAAGKLVTSVPNVFWTPGATKEQMGYDSQGRLLWVDYYTFNFNIYGWQYAFSRRFLWDGQQITAELDQNNTLLQSYTWGPHGLLGITDYPADPSNPNPSAGAKTYLTVEDASGSVILLADPSSGQVVANFNYDPYGLLLSTSGPAAGICPFGFQQMLRDPVTGLYYDHARWYDPAQGRFMSPDPSSNSDENPFIFDDDDPVNKIDLTGLDPTWTGRIDFDPSVAAERMSTGELAAVGQQRHAQYLETSYPNVFREVQTGKYYQITGGPSYQVKEDISWEDWALNWFQTPTDTVVPLTFKEVPPPSFVTAADMYALDQNIRKFSATLDQAASSMRSVVETAADLTPIGLVAAGHDLVAGKSFYDPSVDLTSGDHVLAGSQLVAPLLLGSILKVVKRVGPVTAGEAGRFADLESRAIVGDTLTPHHMPQAALGFTSRADGGAIVLLQADHAQTRTYLRRGAVTSIEDAGLPFRTVLAKDIKDLRRIVGNKYDGGIKDLLDYYRQNFPDLMQKSK